MEHSVDLLQNLTIVLGVAAITCLVFHRLRQPVVLGYLLAGVLIGPHVPFPLVADGNTIHTLSELGVIMLMFSLGLEFSLRKLVKILPTAGIVALIQCSLMLWFGYLAGQAFGWTALESVYAGAIIAISSTTIIVKAFSEEGVKGALSHLVFAVLIVEDLIAVVLLAVLPPFSRGETLSGWMLAQTAAMLFLFLLLLLVVGLLILPRFIRWVLSLKRPEITLLVCVGLAFGISLLAKEMGYSVALGAFLAGSLLAESGEGESLEHAIAPVRDIFAAVFFVSVGMLIEPRVLAAHWGAVLVFTLLVIFGKILSVSFGAFFAGNSTRLSIQSGMSLAQIGEFSFIIAGVGLASGGTRDFLYPIAVSVSAITTLTTPLFIRRSDSVAKWVDRNLPGPLQTFTSLYATWIQRLRRTRPEGKNSALRRLLGLILMDSVLLVAIIIGTSLSLDELQLRLNQWTGLPELWCRLSIVGVSLLLGAPFVIGLIRLSRAIGLRLAIQALPLREDGKLDLAATPRKAMVVSLQVVSLLLVGTPILTLTSPFLPFYFEGTFWGLLLVGIGISFWRSANDLQGHVKAGAEMLLETLEASIDHGKTKALPHAEQILPGIGVIHSFLLDGNSPALEQTLSELNLRALSGACVLAITRKNGGIVAPTGDEVLHEGDLLALSGTEEALESAKQLLLSPTPPSH
ncbi:MAG: cation:proton antiporter [Deltaproteobacteria bacterium]|nr:cation:proton antiporter [Deltaproteobacteria bacterium]